MQFNLGHLGSQERWWPEKMIGSHEQRWPTFVANPCKGCLHIMSSKWGVTKLAVTKIRDLRRLKWTGYISGVGRWNQILETLIQELKNMNIEYKENRKMEANMLHLSTKIIGSCAEWSRWGLNKKIRSLLTSNVSDSIFFTVIHSQSLANESSNNKKADISEKRI